LAILVFNEITTFRFPYKRRSIKWFKEIILNYNKKPGNISIIFCDDSRLLEINQKYLKHFYFTDVITFNYNNSDVISGDIFISLDRVVENASLFNVDVYHELNRVMVHGLLHLLGFKDKSKTEIIEMRNIENLCLSMLNS